MSRVKHFASGVIALSWLTLAGCATNSRIPEIREASFSRSAASAAAIETPYEVQQGDTLYSIAWRYNMDYHDLARWNDIQPPYALRIGQTLRLTAPSAPSSVNAAQVKPLQSSDSMSVPTDKEDDSWLISTPTHPAVNTADAASATTSQAESSHLLPGANADSNATAPTVSDKVPEKAPVAPSTEKNIPPSAAVSSSDKETKSTDTSWRWPTEGTVIGHFSDPSAITAGVDIAGQKGQPVIASRSGTVVYAGNSVRGYGNLVIIKHDDHFLSAYAHNDALKVKANESVKAGQTIATLGDTEADRSILHFEIRQDGQAKDPQQFLPRS